MVGLALGVATLTSVGAGVAAAAPAAPAQSPGDPTQSQETSWSLYNLRY